MANPHKGNLGEERRRSRTEDVKRLYFGKRRAVPQDARWDFILMRGPGGSPEKIEGNTRQDLWVLRGSQSLLQTPESRLLLAKHGQGRRSSTNPVWDLQLAADRKESYAVFVSEDWRTPFMQYLVEGVLPQRHNER